MTVETALVIPLLLLVLVAAAWGFSLVYRFLSAGEQARVAARELARGVSLVQVRSHLQTQDEAASLAVQQLEARAGIPARVRVVVVTTAESPLSFLGLNMGVEVHGEAVTPLENSAVPAPAS